MPRGSRKLAIEFGTESLTHYGGVYLLHRFLSQVQLKNAVAMQVRLAQRNNRYSVVNWLKRFCLPPALQTVTLQTLRQRILLMPAQLRRAGNRPRFPLPASGQRERARHYALRTIDRLNVQNHVFPRRIQDRM